MDVKSSATLCLSVILVSLQCAAVKAEHPWSPIVGGQAVVPPVIPTVALQRVIVPPATLDYNSLGYDYVRRWPPRRRRRRWRRRRFRKPSLRSLTGRLVRPRLRSSYLYYKGSPVRSRPPSPVKYHGGSPRSMEDGGEERGFIRSVRNLFGAPEHCLEGGLQYSCTFAPVCWLTGGVATQGEPVD